MTARWTSLAISCLCAALALTLATDAAAKGKPKAKAKQEAAPKDTRPGWMQDNDCVRKDEGGAGEHEQEELEERTGLRFDESRPAEYATLLGRPDVVIFKLAAINGHTYPVGAWVEASICGFQETCVVASGDFRQFGKRGGIQPGESRFVVFETNDKLGFGTHRITFALFEETGKVVDWLVGEPIKVGYSDIRVDELTYPGSEDPTDAKAKLRDGEGATFSVVVSNFGEAPEAVTAIFAINGGGEYTCGVELYTEPVRIEPEQQGVVLTKTWESPTPGRHVLSVILKDQLGKTLYENYGISFELQ